MHRTCICTESLLGWFKSLGHKVPSGSVQDQDVATRSAPVDQWMEEPEEPLAEQDRVKDFQALLGLTSGTSRPIMFHHIYSFNLIPHS
jgi:hypothetical protein